MKRLIIATTLMVLIASLGVGLGYAQAPKSNDETRVEESPWWCPWCGRSMEGYGPGGYHHMRGYWGDRGYRGWGESGPWGGGRMMGPGYMGPGHMGPGYMGRGYGGPDRWRGYGARRSSGPLTKEEATRLLKRYVRETDNPNLKLGNVTEEKGRFVGEITTKDGSLVDKIIVDKRTGWMRSAY